MRWPARIPAGTTRKELSTTMDLLPTLARFANGVLPSDVRIDGKDISALMLGEPDARTPHDAFFYFGAP
jgi:arylsulfatase A